jgi:AcrR family transcriptional regulator
MSVERTGAGDPARTLALLWRRETLDDPDDPNAARTPRRGPRRALSVQRIVETAVTLADQTGLEAVSMRRIAQALGVVPMTLYTYVPGKPELLDLMLDTIYREMKPTQTRARSWRGRLEAIAHDNRALFRRHPWAALVSTARPPLGPGLLAKYERELHALDSLGLSDVEMDDALTFLLAFVRSCALEEIETHRAATENPTSDAQWWETNAPLLSGLLEQTAYPLASRVGTAAGRAHGAAHSPDHAYRFGLARVMDGLDALIERRRRRAT